MSSSAHDPPDESSARVERRYIALLEQKIAALENDIAFRDGKHQGPTRPRSNSGAHKNGKKSNDPSTSKHDSDQDDGPEATSNESTKNVDGNEDTANPRVRLLDSRYNEATGVWEEKPSKMVAKGKEPGHRLEHAFTWVRKFNQENKYETTKVTINSEPLEAIIKDICCRSPQCNLRSFAGFPSPFPSFAPLVWDWEKLNEVAADTDENFSNETKEVRNDLSLLLEHIRSSPELTSYFEKQQSWSKAGEIEYDYLWTLFRPGEMIYAEPIQGYPQAFIIRGQGEYMKGLRTETIREVDYFTLPCWSYDWNGETFDRTSDSLTIDEYSGLKAISTLPFYPIKYHASLFQADQDLADGTRGNDILSTLRIRGEKFRNMCISPKGSQLFDCKGRVFITHQRQPGRVSAFSSPVYEASRTQTGEDDYSGSTQATMNSVHVIVDHKAYLQQHRSKSIHPLAMDPFFDDENAFECACSECKGNSQLKAMMKVHYDKWNSDKRFEEDDQYILCSWRVMGFIMNSKEWALMPLDSINHIQNKVKKDAFDNLILDADLKTLIRGLVENHEKKKPESEVLKGEEKKKTVSKEFKGEDWIEGKGGGLVILLHGPPGVGKTSTAESVALATGKPLFLVGVSDIGLEPDQVEGSLSKVFKLAAMWEAVLLFDEADVFLESRGTDKGSLKRNTLVSVFLRILEYYDGILILTTNRIKTFDDAVRSRVHLAIRYNNLTAPQLKELFAKFIQLHDKEMDDPRAAMEWMSEVINAGAEFDGRQIRNIVSSARALAKADDNLDGKVKLSHIKNVVKMTRIFQNHLRDQRVSAERDRVTH